MIRWRYLLPRLLMVAAIVLVVRFGLPPLVRMASIHTIQSITGAKAQIGAVDVGLFPPRIHYTQLQIANPSSDKAMRNWVDAESVDLVIDGAALLRRRYEIADARITGLQFDADRSTSGHLETAADEADSQEPSRAMAWLSQWMTSVADAAESRIEQIADDSETRRQGDLIRRRWKAEYESLAQRAEQLEVAIKQVHESAKGIDNPLRDWPQVDQTLAQAKEIQDELVSVRQTLDALPGRVQADLVTLEQAKQIDLQRAREALPLGMGQADSLGPELLSQLLRDQIATIRSYLDTGREVSQWTVATPRAQRLRGESIELNPGQPLPQFLVRRCEVSGALRAGGQHYTLAGILENLTPQSQLRVEPMRARLRLDGQQTIRLDYTRDDSQAETAERLTMHWPEIDAPPMSFGSSNAVDLDVHDGKLELWAQLDSAGDQVQGRLVSRRLNTRLQLTAPDKVARTPMFISLSNSLAAVERLEVDASFSGSWQDPEIRVSSNLTEVLRSGIRDATAGQIAATEQLAAAEVQRVYNSQLNQLQAWLTEQQSQTSKLLVQADSTVQDISRKVISESTKAEAYLGRLRGGIPGLPAIK